MLHNFVKKKTIINNLENSIKYTYNFTIGYFSALFKKILVIWDHFLYIYLQMHTIKLGLNSFLYFYRSRLLSRFSD